MPWKMGEQTMDALQYDFLHVWKEKVEPGSAIIPDSLFAALRERIPPDFAVDVVHPVDPDEVAFLMIDAGGDAILVRFDPPSTTRLRVVGSLKGGRYDEVVEYTDKAPPTLEATFSHDRLDDPVRVTYAPPPRGRTYLSELAEDATGRTERFLKTLQLLAAQPQRQ